MPTYARRSDISSTDGWGNPCEIRVKQDDLLASSVMMIRCPGRDKEFDAATYEVGSFSLSDFDADIVWADGFFVRWPQKDP